MTTEDGGQRRKGRDARATRGRTWGPQTGFAPRSPGSCEAFYSIIICNKRCSIYCDVLVKVLGGRWGDFLIWKFVSPRSILKSISFFLFKCELWNSIESTTFWYSTRPTSTSQSFRVMGVDSDPDRPPITLADLFELYHYNYYQKIANNEENLISHSDLENNAPVPIGNFFKISMNFPSGRSYCSGLCIM